jgi:site-specific recombinase XerD
VDFEKNIVHIKHSLSEGKNDFKLTEPKTKRSVRDYRLAVDLKQVLLEYKTKQAHYALKIGSKWEHKDLVCASSTGGFLDGQSLNYSLQTLTKATPQLPQNLHTHSLRHTFASLLIANGEDPVKVASLIGDSVKTLLEVYAHSFKEHESKTMQAVDDIFSRMTTEPKIKVHTNLLLAKNKTKPST